MSEEDAHFLWEITTPRGQTYHFRASAVDFLTICESVPIGKTDAESFNRAMNLVTLTVRMVRYEALDPIEIGQLEAVFGFIYSLRKNEKWQTDLDALLSTCYHLIKTGQMDRQQAADFAASQLKAHVDETTRDAWRDAWRKRVDRWASHPDRNLPQIGKSRRRKDQLS